MDLSIRPPTIDMSTYRMFSRTRPPSTYWQRPIYVSFREFHSFYDSNPPKKKNCDFVLNCQTSLCLITSWSQFSGFIIYIETNLFLVTNNFHGYTLILELKFGDNPLVSHETTSLWMWYKQRLDIFISVLFQV